MYFTAEQLEHTFLRKVQAAHKLGLTLWQINQVIDRAKLKTTRIAGIEHLTTCDVDALVGSQVVQDVLNLTDPIELRKAMRAEQVRRHGF